jgi:hypothetical protein
MRFFPALYGALCSRLLIAVSVNVFDVVCKTVLVRLRWPPLQRLRRPDQVGTAPTPAP